MVECSEGSAEGAQPILGQAAENLATGSIQTSAQETASKEADPLVCSTCKVTATSTEQLAVHLDGKKHKRLAANAELGPLPEVAPPDQNKHNGLSCDLCNVETGSPLHQEYHLRGQRHQRKQKQDQLLNASKMTAQESINLFLSDDDTPDANTSPTDKEGKALPINSDVVELRQPTQISANGSSLDVRGESLTRESSSPTARGAAKSNLGTQATSKGSGIATHHAPNGVTEGSNQKESSPKGDQATAAQSNTRTMSKMEKKDSGEVAALSNGKHVVTSAGSRHHSVPLTSPFEEAPDPVVLPSYDTSEGVQSVNGSYDLPTSEQLSVQDSAAFQSGYESAMKDLATGGSFSSPALHYCVACGIKATSEPNLQEHYKGRRHARRLQYLSRRYHEQNLTMPYQVQPAGLPLQFSSLVLPSSMDFSSHLGLMTSFSAHHSRASDRGIHALSPGALHSRHHSASSIQMRRSLRGQISNSSPSRGEATHGDSRGTHSSGETKSQKDEPKGQGSGLSLETLSENPSLSAEDSKVEEKSSGERPDPKKISARAEAATSLHGTADAKSVTSPSSKTLTAPVLGNGVGNLPSDTNGAVSHSASAAKKGATSKSKAPAQASRRGQEACLSESPDRDPQLPGPETPQRVSNDQAKRKERGDSVGSGNQRLTDSTKPVSEESLSSDSVARGDAASSPENGLSNSHAASTRNRSNTRRPRVQQDSPFRTGPQAEHEWHQSQRGPMREGNGFQPMGGMAPQMNGQPVRGYPAAYPPGEYWFMVPPGTLRQLAMAGPEQLMQMPPVQFAQPAMYPQGAYPFAAYPSPGYPPGAYPPAMHPQGGRFPTGPYPQPQYPIGLAGGMGHGPAPEWPQPHRQQAPGRPRPAQGPNGNYLDPKFFVDPSTAPYFCEACNVVLPTYDALKHHLQSRAHMRRLS